MASRKTIQSNSKAQEGLYKELQAFMEGNAAHDLIDGAKDLSTNSIKGMRVCVFSTGRQGARWSDRFKRLGSSKSPIDY